MPKYIAITIGPIFNTLNLASSPAALWTGSYMFSYLTKTLCEFIAEVVPEENIVSPYYSKECSLLKQNDGVGLFHDRIIVRTDNTALGSEKLKKIKQNALNVIAKKFEIDIEYLKQYIMIASVEFEAEHAIEGCSKILDCLELAKPFVSEDSNKLFAMFVNEGSENANARIKELPVVKEIGDKWQLCGKNSSIKSLEDIAAAGVEISKRMKKNSYYAIVRSDGDYMSKVFLNLTGDEEIREYSRTCLEYCSKIAELVKEYGGVTIYSGGDDLLALMPLEKKSDSLSDCGDLFSFIKEANNTMHDSFEKLVDELNDKLVNKGKEKVGYPTLSFGVCITYMRHPLYEALSDSQYLLFDAAKKNRNCTALRVQKHSGQSEGIIILNEAMDKMIELKAEIDSKVKVSGTDSKNDADRVFLSALYQLGKFEKFFDSAADSKEIQNLFDNFFDADDHDGNSFLKNLLPEYFTGIAAGNSSYSVRLMPEYLKAYLREQGIKPDEVGEGNMVKPYPTVTLSYLLRILKLYYEKAGEKA